jgi:hypothetical protein
MSGTWVAARTFRDGAHVTWSVAEFPAPAMHRPRGAACLIFWSHGAARRVWEYPCDWRTLPDAELEAVSWRR